jgi:hypothetical protein
MHGVGMLTKAQRCLAVYRLIAKFANAHLSDRSPCPCFIYFGEGSAALQGMGYCLSMGISLGRAIAAAFAVFSTSMPARSVFANSWERRVLGV